MLEIVDLMMVILLCFNFIVVFFFGFWMVLLCMEIEDLRVEVEEVLEFMWIEFMVLMV